MTLREQQPGLDCIGGHHLSMEAFDETGVLVVSWCLWCGTGVSDPRALDRDSRPAGWTPTYRIRVPDGWYRQPYNQGE